MSITPTKNQLKPREHLLPLELSSIMDRSMLEAPQQVINVLR